MLPDTEGVCVYTHKYTRVLQEAEPSYITCKAGPLVFAQIILGDPLYTCCCGYDVPCQSISSVLVLAGRET